MSLKLDQATIQADLALIREKLTSQPTTSESSKNNNKNNSAENLNQIQKAVQVYGELKTQIESTESALQEAQEIVTGSTSTVFQQ